MKIRLIREDTGQAEIVEVRYLSIEEVQSLVTKYVGPLARIELEVIGDEKVTQGEQKEQIDLD